MPDPSGRSKFGFYPDDTPVFDWLRENIWLTASRYETDELTRRASGETLNPAHFRTHLEARYLG